MGFNSGFKGLRNSSVVGPSTRPVRKPQELKCCPSVQIQFLLRTVDGSGFWNNYCN